MNYTFLFYHKIDVIVFLLSVSHDAFLLDILVTDPSQKAIKSKNSMWEMMNNASDYRFLEFRRHIVKTVQ